jgi:gluconate 5-dehydrogenase
MTRHFAVAGQVALVTGSSRGIGAALAHGLHEAGATVVLNGRDRAALDRAAKELKGSAPVHAVAFDVTDADAVDAGIAEVERTAGPLSILVNNTGVQHRAALTEFPDEAWHRLLATNLTGPFLVGRAVARAMAPRRRGKIVNICSVQSELVRPGIAPYSATKGGLKMLTKGMCADLGPLGDPSQRPRPGLFRDRADRAAGGRPRVQRMGHTAHARRAVGEGRGPRRPAAVPRLSRRGLRHRPDSLRRRRHDRRLVNQEHS